MTKRDKTDRYRKWGSVGLRHDTRVRLNKLRAEGDYNSVDELLTEILDTIENIEG